MSTKKLLTTNTGKPVENDLQSITAGPDGPSLLQDVNLVEKLAHFDRERIPERVVHAKGAGAGGYFEVTHDVSKCSRAKFLSTVGKRTEVYARFSQVGGEKGSADSDRDPRGFAVKFYTEEGNYDFVGNNTPVFFIRDAIKFPDFIHTQKRNPASNLKDPDMFWDFLSLTPESIHQVLILFSDRGTPASYRHMHGFSGHTFMWYTSNGEYSWVKTHFLTEQGIQNFTQDEATKKASSDPDQATRDLYENIEQGRFPAWGVYIQIMSKEEAKTYRFDPFDITKVWPHSDYPLQAVGRMVLNRNPANYFAETEQIAFAPGNFVPGIGPSPDRLLQGRIFSYPDTQRHRLGANFNLLPVNSPKGSVEQSYQRDGPMRSDANGDPTSPNYWPNSFGGPAPDASFNLPPLDISGLAQRHEYPFGAIDFVQATALYCKVMSDLDREHLVSNIVGHLSAAQKRLQFRQTALFFNVDPDLGKRVAHGLGLDFVEVSRLAALSQEERVKATMK